MSPQPTRRLLRNLSALAAETSQRLEESLAAGCTRLADARASLEAALGRDIPAAECANMLGQAIAASLPLVAARKEVFTSAGPWLLAQAQPWEQFVLETVLGAEYSVLSTQYSALGSQHFFEHFLAEHRRQHRKRGGVFFTPPQLVSFVCRRVHTQLQEEFGLPKGLAEATILDPAAGSGAFLLGAIDLIHAHRPPAGDWNEYVSERLLPCLLGIEILPAACLAAQLNIAVKLADTGFDFRQPGRIRVELGNALADGADLRFEISDLRPGQEAIVNPPAPQISNSSSQISNLPSSSQISDSSSQISNLKSQISPPLVILGNPPFSSLSDNRGRWITELVRGSPNRPGYVVTADERLGEKKTWLHDDYVKFIRHAQWLVEEVGSGIVGFVTNHGYLDNLTFRLMRRELLRVFDRIDVIDLHGNRKKGETSQGQDPDENVFGLDQGIVIGLLRRLPEGRDQERQFQHSELWGKREEKLARLLDGQDLPQPAKIVPAYPQFLFTPPPRPTPPEYAAAWRLPDAMPVNTTAPVTARDHFVVARTPEELCRRIAEFRDLSIPDDEIRSRHFTRTRSAKYPPGDTRSWKLSAARRNIAAEENWQSFIRRCLYRPFDWRFVFWHPAMIDWPRTAVMDRLMSEERTGDSEQGTERTIPSPLSPVSCPLSPVSCLLSPVSSLILLSRRQMLPTQPCSFFWVADTLALDGVIRSDNRGSESLFPLYLGEPGEAPSAAANFAPAFVAAASIKLELSWLASGRGNLTSTFGPEDLLGYIYALFHSPTYRERYAVELRSDFPRILLPGSRSLYQDLVPRGERLCQWHTLRAAAPPLNGVAVEALREFRAGGHHVLKPSRRNMVSPHDHPLAPYIAATMAEMSAIDNAIRGHGGFPPAFAP